MRLRVGCRFEYEAAAETSAVVHVDPHQAVSGDVAEEQWSSRPGLAAPRFTDLYGNRCRRIVLPAGASSLTYDAVVSISPDPDRVPGPGDAQHRIEDLPDELLHWLLPSRLCESDLLAVTAWDLFGATEPGVARVQAVCDWIHENVEYGVATLPSTTTWQVLEQRGGVCRDFAHLGVAFCRALSIPARYVSGYMPDIGIPGPYPPMDFHGWFEVWLGTRWWTFDARYNTPRIGRVAIGRGRDAVDVAMVTTYGDATLRQMTVWSDEAVDQAGLSPAKDDAAVPGAR